MRQAVATCAVVLLRAAAVAACSDGDVRCLEKGCSAFCNGYTCTHPDCTCCADRIVDLLLLLHVG
jgi:hypothetical protein